MVFPGVKVPSHFRIILLDVHNRAVLPCCSRVGASPDSWPRESWLQCDCSPTLGEMQAELRICKSAS